MAKHNVIICCWNKGHQNELVLNRIQEDALSKKIDKMKAVCPNCRNDGNGNIAIFIKEGETLFSASKTYQCSKGHITSIGTLSSTTLHVRFGHGSEDFFNVEATLDELPEMVDKKEITCQHKDCSSELKAVDDFSLSYPQAGAIKTKTRIGDVWDKQGLEPVRQGGYDKNGEYTASRTEVANKERLRKLQRDRNVSVGNSPGRRLDKPTDSRYGYKNKRDINK